MARHPNAVREFMVCLRAIQPIMADSTASREEKRSTLNMMVNELSEKTFKIKPVAQQIMTIINMQEGVCKEYPDADAQVEGILGWLPRFREHRELLLERVKQHRKQYGLKV